MWSHYAVLGAHTATPDAEVKLNSVAALPPGLRQHMMAWSRPPLLQRGSCELRHNSMVQATAEERLSWEDESRHLQSYPLGYAVPEPAEHARLELELWVCTVQLDGAD
jgi:hypothetical protein